MNPTIQSAAMTDLIALATAHGAFLSEYVSCGTNITFEPSELEAFAAALAARPPIAQPIAQIANPIAQHASAPEALTDAVLELHRAWNAKVSDSQLSDHIDLCARLARVAAPTGVPEALSDAKCEACNGTGRVLCGSGTSGWPPRMRTEPCNACNGTGLTALAAPSTPAIPESDPPIQWPHAWSCSREAKGYGRCVAWCGVESSCVSSPMRAPSTPAERRYCNKCGYFGPDQIHQRPNGSGECDYFSTPIKPAATQGAPSTPAAENKCALCDGRGFSGTPGAQCELCRGTGKGFARDAAPSTPAPAADEGCQYAKDVGMWPEHRCAVKCQYATEALPSNVTALRDVADAVCKQFTAAGITAAIGSPNPAEDLHARAVLALGGKVIREHITSPACWCEPVQDYVDPNTGAAVYVHKDIQ